MATAAGVVLEVVHELGDLVNSGAVGFAPVTPLRAVNRAKIAFFVCPFVPDTDAIVSEVGDVGLAAQKP